jgi:hypothetical protein
VNIALRVRAFEIPFHKSLDLWFVETLIIALRYSFSNRTGNTLPG